MFDKGLVVLNIYWNIIMQGIRIHLYLNDIMLLIANKKFILWGYILGDVLSHGNIAR